MTTAYNSKAGNPGGGMAKAAVAQNPKPKPVKCYTAARRGGGWVMLTLLADESCVVDESELDSREAIMTRMEQEVRRME